MAERTKAAAHGGLRESRIIEIAATGERNPDELARRALQALGLKSE
jgi:hypothetical protein